MRLLFILLLCLLFWTPAFGEVVVVMRPWVQVRTQPKADAKPIAIVYGNDSYDVIEEREQWVRIRAAGKSGGAGVAGWVPRDTVYPIIEPIARKSFAYAQGLKNAGKEPEARGKLYEVMRRFPGTVQSYEATRLLLTYHPGRGPLPDPQNGIVDTKARAEAERINSWLFVEEGKLLIREERYADAVSMFEEARARGKFNRSAMDGIRQALQAQHRDGSREESRLALVALKVYFPNIPEAELETFAVPKLGIPETIPPQMAPLVPPGAPIEEGESATPELHDFEEKELELAPSAPAMPEQEKSPEQENSNDAPAPEQENSNDAPAPEQEPADKSNAQSPALPNAETAPSSVKSEPALAAPAPRPGRQEAATRPAEREAGLAKPTPAKPAPRNPARRSAPPAQANLSAPPGEPRVALPQSVPPGFAPPAPAASPDRPRARATGAQTMPMAMESAMESVAANHEEPQPSATSPTAQEDAEATAIARTLSLPGMKGLWPVREAQAAEVQSAEGSGGSVAERQAAPNAAAQPARKPLPPLPPPAPPSLNDLSERPPAAMARKK